MIRGSGGRIWVVIALGGRLKVKEVVKGVLKMVEEMQRL